MSCRTPLAQRFTLDFDLITVRNAARGRELLGAAQEFAVDAPLTSSVSKDQVRLSAPGAITAAQLLSALAAYQPRGEYHIPLAWSEAGTAF